MRKKSSLSQRLETLTRQFHEGVEHSMEKTRTIEALRAEIERLRLVLQTYGHEFNPANGTEVQWSNFRIREYQLRKEQEGYLAMLQRAAK